MFMFRAAFWIAVVLAFLPVDRTGDENSLKVSLGTALIAAQATVADLTGFCGRNPDVCDVGREVGTTFAARAETGARALYQMTREVQTAPVPASDTAPVPTIEVRTNTLTDADIAPTWVAPDRG